MNAEETKSSPAKSLQEQKGVEEQHANALYTALHEGWDAIPLPSLPSWLHLLEAHPELFLRKGGTEAQLILLQGLLSQWRELCYPHPESLPLFLSSPLLPILRDQNKVYEPKLENA